MGEGKKKERQNSLLALVDLDVPLAPDLGGSEHATRSAHVTESSLTSTVSTATRDTRNTGDSATCEDIAKSAGEKFSSPKHCAVAKQSSQPQSSVLCVASFFFGFFFAPRRRRVFVIKKNHQSPFRRTLKFVIDCGYPLSIVLPSKIFLPQLFFLSNLFLLSILGARGEV